MAGGYLRTNFTRSGNATLTAIGGGYALTSYAGGAGLLQPYAGFIMGDLSINGASVGSITAYEAMSAWFGSGLYGSGYKIKVFAVNVIMQSTTAIGIYATAGATSNILFVPVNSAALGANTTPSAALTWVGFITSAP